MLSESIGHKKALQDRIPKCLIFLIGAEDRT